MSVYNYLYYIKKIPAIQPILVATIRLFPSPDINKIENKKKK